MKVWDSGRAGGVDEEAIFGELRLLLLVHSRRLQAACMRQLVSMKWYIEGFGKRSLKKVPERQGHKADR